MEKEQEFNFGEEQQQDEAVAKKPLLQTVKGKYLSLPKYLQIVLPVVIIIIILLLIYFLIFSSPAFSLKIIVDGKQFSDVNSVSLFSNDGKIEFIVENGLIIFGAEKDITVTVKIKLTGETITKQILTNKKDLVLNITTSKETDFEGEETAENVFSIFFTSKNGILNKTGKVKLECEDYSQELPVANGKLENIKIPCKIISVIGNIEGIPPVSQSCNPGMCKLLFEDPVSSDVKLEQNLIKSKLIVYVNYKDGTSAKDISVEIREDSIGNELVDLGKTKDFGAFSLDLAEGKYIVLISDPSGKYASQQQKVSVPSSPVNFVLDTPAIGNINVTWDLEDNNVLSGNAILKDENLTFLESKSFDTNSVLFFPIKEKGIYKLSFSLASKFADYITEDQTVNYDLNSGDLNITAKIRKVNPFTDQNVVVQVIDSVSKKPISFAKIYFVNAKDEFLSNIGNQGFADTDANGVFSKIFPVGTYVVKLDHDYLSGAQSFNVEQTKSLTMTTKFVTLPVVWGNANFEVCLKDLTGDAFIDVYSLAGGFQSSFFIEKDKSCAKTSVKSLETVYVHVTKEGFFEKYSQAVFLENNKEYKIELNLTPIKPNLPQAKLESEFLGIYTTSFLTEQAKKLDPLTDYFYAFKVKLPQNTTKKIKFVGVAGDLKDENAVNSKMQVRLLNSVGQASYFEHFSPSKKTVEENETAQELDFTYNAKSFTSTYALDKTPEQEVEIIYVVKVAVTNNVYPEVFGGDTLLFSYWFGFDDEQYDKLIKIVEKTGTRICDTPVCIDAYLNKMSINIDAPVEEAPLKGNIFAKIIFGNMNDTNISIYNAPENGNVKKKSDITQLNIALDNFNSSVITNTVSGSKDKTSLNFGPIYLENLNIKQGSYLDFDANFEMLTPESSIIEFRTYDSNWESPSPKGIENIKLIPVSTKELKVYILPASIVPYIANKISMDVSYDSVPVVGAEVKYYSYESANWKYKKTVETDKGGVAVFETDAVGLGDKIKIVVSKDDYKLFEKELPSDFNFLDVLKDVQKIEIIYPNDVSPVNDKNMGVVNNSDYDVNIYNVKYTLDSKANPDVVNMLLKIEDMQNHFKDGRILGLKSELKSYLSYDPSFLLSLGKQFPVNEKMFFQYLPKDISANFVQSILGTEFYKVVPLEINFGFEGKPENAENCFMVGLEEAPISENGSWSSGSAKDTDADITFLEGQAQSKVRLKIINNCLIKGNKLDLDRVELTLNGAEGLEITGVNQNKEEDAFNLGSFATNTNLYGPVKEGTYYYNFNFLLGADFTDETLQFTITPYYKTTVSDPVAFSSNNLSLKIDNTRLGDCLKFGVPEDLANREEFLMSTLLPDAGLDETFLRMPYNKLSYNFFQYASIPLELKNDCGVPLEVKVVNKTITQETLFLYDKYWTNFLFVNPIISLNSSEKKNFTLSRVSEYSGAIVLELDVENKKSKEYEPAKFLKINIESSNENNGFVKNPFYDSSIAQAPKMIEIFCNNYSSNYDYDIQQTLSTSGNFMVVDTNIIETTGLCTVDSVWANYEGNSETGEDESTILGYGLHDLPIYDYCGFNAVYGWTEEGKAIIGYEEDNATGLFKIVQGDWIPIILDTCKKDLSQENAPTFYVDPETKVILFDLSPLPQTGYSSEVPNCSGGGFTGSKYAPFVSYIEDANCAENVCSLKQFSSYLELAIKGTVSAFKVKLMHDDYSKESLEKIAEGSFLETIKKYAILNTDGTSAGILGPGVYSVTIKDANTIFLSYSSILLPDHLFYYMPDDGLVVDDYGTSVDNPILWFDAKNQMSLSGATTGLNNYTISETPFNLLNTTDYGTILSGNPKDHILYFNNFSRQIYTVDLNVDENKIVSGTINGESVAPEIIKQKWFAYLGADTKTKFYPETVGIKIDEKDNGIQFTNNSNKKVILKRMFFVPKTLSLKLFNTNKVEGFYVAAYTLSSVASGISDSSICYKKEGDFFKYYYNPNNNLN